MLFARKGDTDLSISELISDFRYSVNKPFAPFWAELSLTF